MAKGVKKDINKILKKNILDINCKLSTCLCQNFCVIFPIKREIRINNDWAKSHREEIGYLLKLAYNYINKKQEKHVRGAYFGSISELEQMVI